MLRLNSAHDVDKLARSFAERGRMQVRASWSRRMLSMSTACSPARPRWMAFNDGDRVAQVSPEMATEQRNEKRMAAYVLNLTKDGTATGAGYLQFYDSNGDIRLPALP